MRVACTWVKVFISSLIDYLILFVLNSCMISSAWFSNINLLIASIHAVESPSWSASDQQRWPCNQLCSSKWGQQHCRSKNRQVIAIHDPIGADPALDYPQFYGESWLATQCHWLVDVQIHQWCALEPPVHSKSPAGSKNSTAEWFISFWIHFIEDLQYQLVSQQQNSSSPAGCLLVVSALQLQDSTNHPISLVAQKSCQVYGDNGEEITVDHDQWCQI